MRVTCGQTTASKPSHRIECSALVDWNGGKRIGPYGNVDKEKTSMDGSEVCEGRSAVVRSGMSEVGAIAVAVMDGKVTGIRFGHSSKPAAVAALLETAVLSK